MSEALERKIVELQFDNAEFERRVAKSMKTIESLKKELDFDESAKSLDRLEKAANDISFKGLEKETTSLGDLFDWSSIFKISLLQKVADQVIGTATRMLKSMTIDNVTAGMTKYEMKTKSVQTIMAATGKSVAEVEKVLERLNYYTDMTSYDFADMTNNIGKFTSAGIDLETAEVAMEGIANWAAVSGQEIAGASRAMYNLSQALSVGHVKLIDWKSIENANMATKEFKEYVIETAIGMGKLQRIGDKVGKTLKGTSVDFKNFSQTLSEGWFDNDVLIATLTQYADTNTEIGSKAYDAARKALTFTQAMQAVRDSISTGWMKTWQLLFGDVEEAGTFFTNLCDSIIEVTERIDEARNNLLQEWRDFTSIFTDENGTHYKGKDMASLIFHTVWDTIVSVGAAISRAMEMVANPSSVLFGNGGFDMHGWTVAVENIEDLATGNMLGKITDGILGFVGAIREFIYGESIFGGQRIVKLVHIFTGLFSILDIGRQIIGSILGFVGRIVKYLTPLVDAALEIGAALGDVFYMIDLSLRSGGLKALGDSLFEFLRPALNWLNSVGTKIKDWVLKQIEKIPDLLDKITKKITKFLDSLRKWGKRVTDVFKPILRPIEYIWSIIKGWFSGEGLENMNLWDKIQEIWKRITNTDFSKWKISFQLAFADIKNRASTLWNVIKDTVKQKWGIDLSWVDEAVSTIRQKWDAFTTWWQGTAIYKWFTESDKETGLTGFQTVAYAIGDAFKNAWDFFTEPDANGETGFQRWKQNLLDRCNEIKLAIENWQGWKDIGKFFSSIWDWFTKRQVHGLKTDEEGNLAGWEFVGTGAEYAAFKIKNWFVQAAKDVEKWWNSDNPFSVVFRTIANGVWTGLTTIWNFFTDDNTDTGKTQFQNWVDKLYEHYEEIKTKITTWKGWDDISDFFRGIWDYFTKKGNHGLIRDENNHPEGFEFFGTGFEYTIYQVKQWFDKVGGEIDAWWNGDNIIRTAFETIKGWFGGIVNWFKEEALPRNGVGEGPSFEAFFVNVGDDIKAAWEKITAPGTFLGGLKNTVGDLFSSVWDWFTKRKVHGLKVDEEGNLAGWEFVGTGVGYAVYKITEWFNNVADEITVWWNGDNLLRKAIEFIWGEVEGLLKWVENKSKPRTEEEAGDHPIILFFRHLAEDIEKAWNDIAGEGTFLHELAETVKGFFKPIWDALFGVEAEGPTKEQIDKAWQEYSNKFKSAKMMLSDVGGGSGGGRPMSEKQFKEWYASEGYATDEAYLNELAESKGITGFLKRVQTKLNEFWTWAEPYLLPVQQFFTDIWNAIHDFFTKEIEEYGGNTGWEQAISDFVTWLDGIWNTVKSWGGWEEIASFFREIGSAIGDFFTNLFGGGKKTEKPELPTHDPFGAFKQVAVDLDDNEVKKTEEKSKKVVSVFDLLHTVFLKIAGVFEGTSVKEIQDVGGMLTEVSPVLQELWNAAVGIIRFIAGGNVIEMGMKYALFRFGIGLLGGVCSGLALLGESLGMMVAGGIMKWLGKKMPVLDGLFSLQENLPQLLFSVSAVVASVALFAGVFSNADWEDMGKITLGMTLLTAMIMGIVMAYNSTSKLSEVNIKHVKNEKMWDAIAKMGTSLLNGLTFYGTITYVINHLSDINKTDPEKMKAAGQMILDIALGLASTLVSMSIALKLTKGMGAGGILKGTAMLMSIVGIVILMSTIIGDIMKELSGGSDVHFEDLSYLGRLFEGLGGAIGKLVGGIVAGFQAAVFEEKEREKAEEIVNSAKNALTFAEKITGLGEQVNPEDAAAFERIIEYVERYADAAEKMGSYGGAYLLQSLANYFGEFGTSINKVYTALTENPMNHTEYSSDFAAEKLEIFSELILLTQMMTSLVIELHSSAEKLGAAIGDGTDIFGKDGRDFRNLTSSVYKVMESMLTYDEIGADGIPETLAFKLGKTMGEYYRGVTYSTEIEKASDALTEKFTLSIEGDRNSYRNAGKATVAALAEGMLEGQTVIVSTASFLGTAALESYNKSAGAATTAAADKLMDDVKKMFADSGVDTSGIMNLLKDPAGYVTSKTTEGVFGTTGIESFASKLLGFDISDESNFSELETMLSTKFVGEDGTGGLIGTLMSSIDGSLTNDDTGMSSIAEGGMTDMLTTLSGYTGQMTTTGKNLILGLANGLRNNVKDATDAAAFVARQVLLKFHQVWEIHSPSEETEQDAIYLVEGLSNGLAEEGPVFIAEIEQFAGDVGDIFAEEFSSRVGAAVMEEFREAYADSSGPVKKVIESITDVNNALNSEGGQKGVIDLYRPVVDEIVEDKKELLDIEALMEKQGKKKKPVESMVGKDYGQALSNSIKGIFDLADSDLTYEPVIRPIIDWSNVTANVGYGGRILSGMPGLTGGTYAAGTLEETMKIQNGKNNGDLYNVVVDIRDKVDQLDRDVMNMKIVLNTGVLAGELVNDIDNELGQRVLNNGRAN